MRLKSLFLDQSTSPSRTLPPVSLQAIVNGIRAKEKAKDLSDEEPEDTG